MGIPGWEHIERSDEMIALVLRKAKGEAQAFAVGRLCVLCKLPVTADNGGPASPDQSCNSRHVWIWAHAACMGNVPRFAPPAEVLAAVSPCVLMALAAYNA